MSVPNRGPEFAGVVGAFLAFAILSTLIRCYVRILLVKAFGLDDWFMVLALAFFIIHSTWALLGVKHGTGRHFVDLTYPEISKAMMYWWCCYTGYALTMIASKVSIAVFLLRITAKSAYNKVIWCTLATAVVPSAAFIFVCILQCRPVDFFWTRFVDPTTQGQCIDLSIIMILTYIFSTLSVLTDFVFTLLPIFMVWKLNMKAQSKWLLAPVFLLGCVASSAVVVRFAYVEEFRDPDYLWATVDIAIWSTVEMGLAIVAGNLALMRPLVRLIFQKLGISTWGRSSSPSHPTLSNAGLRFNTRYHTAKRTRPDREQDRPYSDDFYAMADLGTHTSTAWDSRDGAGVEAGSGLKVVTETQATITAIKDDSSARWGERTNTHDDISDGDSQKNLRQP